MDGACALIISIVGCEIKDEDLKDGETTEMRRYPITAEDAFKCYAGLSYEYEAKFPDYYDIADRYRYKQHDNKKIVIM